MWTRLQYGLQSVSFWKTHIQGSKMLYTAELGTRPNCFDVLALPHHELKASLRFLYICWRITLHHFQICQKMFIRSYVQGWEFAHSLIAHRLICSFAHRSFAHLLKSLWSNKRLAQIAQDKWATVSKSLRLLRTNEPPWANSSGTSWKKSELLVFLANRSFAHKKQVIHFKKID